MIAVQLCFVSLAMLAQVQANDADTETVGDYFERPQQTKQRYADYMANLLRVNHPKLTGEIMRACLDEVARYPNNRAMHLKAAVTICANASE